MFLSDSFIERGFEKETRYSFTNGFSNKYLLTDKLLLRKIVFVIKPYDII